MDFVFQHLPFFSVAAMIAALEHAIPAKRLGRKESVVLLSVAAAVGLFWIDPEFQGWDRMTSIAYFACAGVAGIVAVSVARKMGYNIKLPGSDPSTKD